MMMPPRAVFEVYVDDDRYSVPTLHLLVADEAMAWRIADEMLRENTHHRGAELWCEGRRVARLGSPTQDGMARSETEAH